MTDHKSPAMTEIGPEIEAMAQELALMDVRGNGVEAEYSWAATDRIWKESYRQKSRRLWEAALRSRQDGKPIDGSPRVEADVRASGGNQISDVVAEYAAELLKRPDYKRGPFVITDEDLRVRASGGEVEIELRRTTEEMANLASVPMDLWQRHSTACLKAASTIERLTRETNEARKSERELVMHIAIMHIERDRAEAELTSLRAENERLREGPTVLSEALAAYEAIPSDYRHSVKVVEAWLEHDLVPALRRARQLLEEREDG